MLDLYMGMHKHINMCVCVCNCVFSNHKEAINLRFGGGHGKNWKEGDWEELEERTGEGK